MSKRIPAAAHLLGMAILDQYRFLQYREWSTVDWKKVDVIRLIPKKWLLWLNYTVNCLQWCCIICQLLLKLSSLPPDSCSRTLTCFINLKNVNMLHARSLRGTLGLRYLSSTLPRVWLSVLKASSGNSMAKQLGTRLLWKELWAALPEAGPCFAWEPHHP